MFDHHRGPELARLDQREPADRAHVHLVLADLRGVERIVAAVVNARRDLVDQQVVAGLEELDAERADDLEPFGDRRRVVARARVGDSGATRPGTIVVASTP